MKIRIRKYLHNTKEPTSATATATTHFYNHESTFCEFIGLDSPVVGAGNLDEAAAELRDVVTELWYTSGVLRTGEGHPGNEGPEGNNDADNIDPITRLKNDTNSLKIISERLANKIYDDNDNRTKSIPPQY